MKVVVRCIYYKAVTPSCDIIDMDNDTWRKFFLSTASQRKELALRLLKKEHLSVKEIAWIPLDGQDKIVEV